MRGGQLRRRDAARHYRTSLDVRIVVGIIYLTQQALEV
jgi:hypothetical protein